MDATDVVGTTVLDHSGNSMHGEIIGSPAPVISAGRIGEALDFTAVNRAYVDVAGIALESDARSRHDRRDVDLPRGIHPAQ